MFPDNWIPPADSRDERSIAMDGYSPVSLDLVDPSIFTPKLSGPVRTGNSILKFKLAALNPSLKTAITDTVPRAVDR